MMRLTMFLLVISCLSVANSAIAFDSIKKWISPKSYWQKKVAEAEEVVKGDKADLYSCRLDIAKLQRTRDITVKQDILLGMTPQEAQEIFIIEYQATVETCKAIREILQESQKNVENAKDELEKAQ